MKKILFIALIVLILSLSVLADYSCGSKTLNCVSLSSTNKTCYTLSNRKGGNFCSEGWNIVKEIPKSIKLNRYICDYNSCVLIS